MQELSDNKDLSAALMLFDTLLEEQSLHGDDYGLPINALRNVKAYVKASSAILILFDAENPEWANKKILGTDQAWVSETAFLLRDSILCHFTAEYITSIQYTSESDPRFDHVI